MEMKEIVSLIRDHLKGRFEFEIYFQRTKKTKIESSSEKLENLSTSEEAGVGIRILKDNRIGFSFTTDLSRETLVKALDSAVQMWELQNPDPAGDFVDELKISRGESVFDQEGVGRSLEDKIDFVISLEKKAKERDGRIRDVRKSSLTERITEVSFFNSRGIEYSFDATHYTAMIAAVAEDGKDSSISYEFRGERKLSSLDTEDIVKDAVFKTTSLLNPKPVKTQVMPVILFRDSSAMILSAFARMFLGDSLIKDKTLLKDKRNEEVASQKLTVIDDGTLPGGFSTYPYDGEGFPSAKTTVIEKGVFKNFLHSLYTARTSGEPPTGNSVRESFKNPPSSGYTNLFIEKGEGSFEDMLYMREKVFVVLEVMGLHTVDPISGEFSLGASGVIYKNGKLVQSVRGVTIAGNIIDLWNKIVEVGSDLRFYGDVGSPSLLVDDITVGGN